MRQLHFDAFICGSASDILLLTGYWPVMGTSVAVFTMDGDVHVVIPEDEVELAGKSSEASLTPYKPAELPRLIKPIDALSDPLRLLTSRLRLCKATIGMQIDQGMQPAAYASSCIFRSSLRNLVRSLLPRATFVASDDALEEMKSRKTPTELEQMRKAIEIACAGFEIARQSIHEGRREAEVAADLQAAFQSSAKATAVQRSYGFFFCMSGPNSACASAAYARTRQRRIERGDLVMIHANTCADGYWTDITRTYTAGTSDKRQEAMRTAITEAGKAALAAVRPRVAARDVDGAARSVMAAHGFGDAFKHSTGHGVGFAAANANALPRIHPQSPDVLDIGMTFNVEPAAYFNGYGGMRHCDVVTVTDDGVNVLTEF
ncbi:MAG TPA: Xaa-Pro peptidase family protein [Terriglobales bacterium]|nr:Xaa-Pro peptidase family protein [Terriglobales bacterium]